MKTKIDCDFLIGKCDVEDSLELMEVVELDVFVSVCKESKTMKDKISVWASNRNDMYISIDFNIDKTQKLIKALETCLSMLELEKSLRDVD